MIKRILVHGFVAALAALAALAGSVAIIGYVVFVLADAIPASQIDRRRLKR